MKTADPEFMRAINRFHVMDAIRRFGPIARVEICERTELEPHHRLRHHGGVAR